MGMYDDVLADVNCMNCGKLLEIFQTKAFEYRCLRKIQLGEDVRKEVPECENNQTFEMHTFCDDCGVWHDAEGLIVDGIFTEVTNIKMKDKVEDVESS